MQTELGRDMMEIANIDDRSHCPTIESPEMGGETTEKRLFRVGQLHR